MDGEEEMAMPPDTSLRDFLLKIANVVGKTNRVNERRFVQKRYGDVKRLTIEVDLMPGQSPTTADDREAGQ